MVLDLNDMIAISLRNVDTNLIGNFTLINYPLGRNLCSKI